MLASAILALGSALLATSVAGAPAPQIDLGLTLDTLNGCLFKDPLTKLTLDSTKVLDLESNTCLSTTACLAAKVNEIVNVKVVANLLAVPVCQRKTCPATLSLNNDGLCVCLDAQIFGDSTRSSCIAKSACTGTKGPVGTGATAYCGPKTCPRTLTLNKDGLCVCASGYVFSSVLKTSCILASRCTPLLFNLNNGVCSTKSCPQTQLLSGVTGLCIEKTACDTALNSLTKYGLQVVCEPKACGANMTIDKSSGLCVCTNGLIFGNANKNTCIGIATCDTKLNSIVNGVCLPKVCLKSQLLDMKTGLCISADLCNSLTSIISGGICKPKACASNQTLNTSTGLCELKCLTNQLLNPAKTKCVDAKYCPTALNVIDGKICKPKTACTGTGNTLLNGVCLCASGFQLGTSGLCELPKLVCKSGQLLNPSKTLCIDSKYCPTALNTITNGVCIPKSTCKGSGQLLANGVCLCGSGFQLNVLGICVGLNINV